MAQDCGLAQACWSAGRGSAAQAGANPSSTELLSGPVNKACMGRSEVASSVEPAGHDPGWLGGRRREGSVRYKSGAGGARTREALLNPKSHRRVNRRQVGFAAGFVPEVLDASCPGSCLEPILECMTTETGCAL